jgi:hypothetical protein
MDNIITSSLDLADAEDKYVVMMGNQVLKNMGHISVDDASSTVWSAPVSPYENDAKNYFAWW